MWISRKEWAEMKAMMVTLEGQVAGYEERIRELERNSKMLLIEEGALSYTQCKSVTLNDVITAMRAELGLPRPMWRRGGDGEIVFASPKRDKAKR